MTTDTHDNTNLTQGKGKLVIAGIKWEILLVGRSGLNCGERVEFAQETAASPESTYCTFWQTQTHTPAFTCAALAVQLKGWTHKGKCMLGLGWPHLTHSLRPRRLQRDSVSFLPSTRNLLHTLCSPRYCIQHMPRIIHFSNSNWSHLTTTFFSTTPLKCHNHSKSPSKRAKNNQKISYPKRFQVFNNKISIQSPEQRSVTISDQSSSEFTRVLLIRIFSRKFYKKGVTLITVYYDLLNWN